MPLTRSRRMPCRISSQPAPRSLQTRCAAAGDQLNLDAFEQAAPALESAEASLGAITADVAGIETDGTPAKVQDAVSGLRPSWTTRWPRRSLRSAARN